MIEPVLFENSIVNNNEDDKAYSKIKIFIMNGKEVSASHFLQITLEQKQQNKSKPVTIDRYIGEDNSVTAIKTLK